MYPSKNYPRECHCPFCGTAFVISIDLFNLLDYERGVPVQVAFPAPFYTAEERETIKTGMCKKCQDEIFG